MWRYSSKRQDCCLWHSLDNGLHGTVFSVPLYSVLSSVGLATLCSLHTCSMPPLVVCGSSFPTQASQTSYFGEICFLSWEPWNSGYSCHRTRHLSQQFGQILLSLVLSCQPLSSSPPRFHLLSTPGTHLEGSLL